jgi:glycosyltransferase 2 family protein
MKKIVLGIIISSLFIYFSLRNINFNEFVIALQGKSYHWVFPILGVFFAVQVLRSIRWGVILSPIQEIEQKTLFPIACVGYAAIIVFPMRLGEFVRPYLVNLRRSIPFGSGIASIVMERFMDILILMGFFSYILTQIDLPPWITRSGYGFLSVIILGFAFIILFILKPAIAEKVIHFFISRLPKKISYKIERFVLNFLAGFRVIGNIQKTLQILSLSFLIWFLSAGAIYLLFSLFHLHFGIVEAITITVITALGVSIPAAPGLIGNFQFACMIPLSLWGIAKPEAFAFSMIYYFLGVGTNIFLGLISLPGIHVSIKQLLQSIKYQKQ